MSKLGASIPPKSPHRIWTDAISQESGVLFYSTHRTKERGVDTKTETYDDFHALILLINIIKQ